MQLKALTSSDRDEEEERDVERIKHDWWFIKQQAPPHIFYGDGADILFRFISFGVNDT